MVRFGMVAAALAMMAAPLLAQESTEQLKKELEQLRAKVDALSVNSTKEIPAQGKIDADAMAADDNPLMTMLKGTKLSGFVDVGLQFSFNHLNSFNSGTNNAGENPIRIFDNRANSFYMHEAHLQLERLASKDMIVGYHIELVGGHDPAVYDGSNVIGVDIQEAWVQILAPVGPGGLDIRAGRMATLVGYEVLENINNMNYSRGMLFGIIQPFTSTGVRASMGFGGKDNDMVSFTLGLSNGFNAGNAAANGLFEDNDHGKALELQVAVRPVKDVYAAATFIVDNDTAFFSASTNDKHYIFDLVASYTMDKLTVAANYSKTSHQGDAIVPTGVRMPMSGLAVYGKWAWSDTQATALRVEYFSDGLGQVVAPVTGNDTGTGARVISLTLTQEMKIANRLILRIEVRHDDSNQHNFTRGVDGNPSRGDNTLGFEAIMPF